MSCNNIIVVVLIFEETILVVLFPFFLFRLQNGFENSLCPFIYHIKKVAQFMYTLSVTISTNMDNNKHIPNIEFYIPR